MRKRQRGRERQTKRERERAARKERRGQGGDERALAFNHSKLYADTRLSTCAVSILFEGGLHVFVGGVPWRAIFIPTPPVF